MLLLMRLHRFIIKDPELLHQWREVLRLRAGEQVVLADGAGTEVRAEIKTLAKDHAELEPLGELTTKPESGRQVTLYCAVLKSDHFELVAQKATEIGVTAIQPIITIRTVKTSLRLGRLEKIIKKAAEQSSRTTLPQISEPMSFEEAISEASKHEQNYFLDPATEQNFKTIKAHDVAIWIGPEGGWTAEELAKSKEFAKAVSISPFVLRAETAAIVASYLTLHA